MDTPSPPEPARTTPSLTATWVVAIATVVGMASLPFLNLVASNPDTPIDVSVLRTWWLVTLAPALVVLVVAMVARPRLGRWVGGMLGTGIYLLWNLPLTDAIRDAAGIPLTEGRWWLAFTVAVLVLAAPLMRLVPAQRFVAIVAVVLAGTSAATIVPRWFEADPSPVDRADQAPATDGFVRANDVWFIVPDGLAGGDALADLGLDSTSFEQALEADGFRIQRGATSNYPLTNLSLSATLSMDYTFTGTLEPTEGDYFLHMSGGNATVELLRANGYAYAHAFPGFYIGSRCVGFEDACFGDTGGSITETETALATLTPLRRFILARTETEDIAFTNDPASTVRAILADPLASPAYHFVHALNPHPPFLRDADCDVRDVELDLAGWGDGPEYLDAVRCVHRQLERAAELILTADPDAIVVIQGDHGTRLGQDPTTSREAVLDEDINFSIFSAIHLPDACEDLDIPDDLTPVNTFRIVRACLEDRAPDLLEDRRFPIRRQRP